ncbi:MAG: hypothetical protein AAB834_02415, partial [Patescibacteria group bacterium]
ETNDRKVATAKAARIRQAGRDRLRAEVDCDKTIIIGSIWDGARAILSEEEREAHTALSRPNLEKLSDGSLTLDEAAAWQTTALDYLKGRPLSALVEAMATIPLRKGAEDFFNICEQAAVPTIIRSASISDAISAIASQRNIRPTLIVATNLHIRRGHITGWDPATLTHDLNKGSVVSRDLSSLVNGRNNIILLGDRMVDTLMVPDKEALRIRVDGGFDPSQPDEWGAYLRESFNLNNDPRYPHAYDAVTTTDDLFAVAKLISWLTTGP